MNKLALSEEHFIKDKTGSQFNEIKMIRLLPLQQLDR